MDPENPNLKSRTTPQYALYQRQNFWKTNDGEVPLFNTGTPSPHLRSSILVTLIPP
jgi:hypothetical protein